MSFTSPKKQGGAQPRQIRFVSTDGQPQTKRRRVNAACRTCRKRKIRCSGEQPECKTCSNYGHKCLGYNDPPNLSSSSTSASAQLANGPRSPEIKKSASPQLARASLPSSVSDTSQHARDSHSTPGTQEALPRNGKEVDPGVAESPESTRSALISSNRTHVPYFRYFGPTAIVPGFKQMVVRVRESRKGNPSLSDSISSGRGSKVPESGDFPSSAFADSRMSHSIPFYDPEDSLPVSSLIMHLCEIFFTHLGCNFPFLQRDRFLRDLKEKQIEPILVDAVCALAARFSLHPLLATQQRQSNGPGSGQPPETKHADQGQLFAHRAMCAVVDAFSCPTLAVVQACLLLAYEEFGSNHDSGLWMYLGISIRMAQDLGLQKLEGMKYNYGCVGLTPKLVKSGQANNFDETPLREALNMSNGPNGDGKGAENVERAIERERVDSFWSIFFLDRVISSGTGRPVTLRDDDIEIFFPLQSESDLENGWPSPFPHLMRIIHLYGRITDLLNAIKEVNHVTPETLRTLAGMESDLTGIYQRLSLKLHFNAVNFQTYIKAGEGTNFILLHFWFHTLIVLLHQPTLLHSFGGKIQQLFPNSRELSMSSAKTIADILAFAELIDAKSFIGNPFTSQPIYIAACAFLMESALYSMPSSRAESPPPQSVPAEQPTKFNIPVSESHAGQERGSNPKHTLLASAAKDNYQRCYKALKSLEVYWEGVKYILTVLDQKAKGIGDPQLYTEEEMDNTAEQPEEQEGEQTGEPLPGWKRTAQHRSQERIQKEGGSVAAAHEGQTSTDDPSQRIDPSQAIGWALTGQTDSSQPNVSFLYQLSTSEAESTPHTVASFPPQFGDNYQAMHSPNEPPQSINPYSHIRYPSGGGPVSNHDQQSLVSPAANYSPLPSDMSPPDTKYRLAVNSNYSTASQNSNASQRSFQHDIANHQVNNTPPSYTYDMSPAMTNRPAPDAQRLTSNPLGGHGQAGPPPHGLTIESQDVDMNALHGQNSFPFTFDGEFIPWLEYLPQDVLSYFGYNQNYRPMMNPEDSPGQPPPPSV